MDGEKGTPKNKPLMMSEIAREASGGDRLEKYSLRFHWGDGEKV